MDNQSDHCPIVLSLNIDVCQTIHSPTVHRSRKLWNRAFESDKTIYRNVLDNCLKCIHAPIESINYNNMLCNESVHINCIKKINDDIVLAAITASDVIPETVKQSNNFPGLTKETSYLREIALFWRSIWISLNSPRSGIRADIMRHTRCK